MVGRSTRSRLTDLTTALRQAGRPETGDAAEPTPATGETGEHRAGQDRKRGPSRESRQGATQDAGQGSAPAIGTVATTPETEDERLAKLWPSRWLLLVLAVVVGPATFNSALNSIDPQIGVPEFWASVAPPFIALSAWWRGGRLPRTRGFWLSAALLGCVNSLWLTMHFGMGAEGAWIGTVTVLIAVLGLILYRASLPRDSWAPLTPANLVALLATCFAVSLLGVALSAYPDLRLGQVDLQSAVWWTSRNLANLWIGAATFFMFLYWRRPHVLRFPAAWQSTLIVLAGCVCMYLPRAHTELPLAWLSLVPALWAGMVLTPMGAAAYALFSSGASAFSAAAHPQAGNYTGILANSTITDQLLVFSSFLTMLLVLFRDERVRLAKAMRDERVDAAEVSGMLEAVFEAMSDGVLLADPIGGGIVMHNRSARRMLGQPIPRHVPASWASYFGIRTPDGSAPVAESDLPLWFEKGSDSLPPKPYGILNSEGEWRVVAASAHLLRSPLGPRVLLLFHDVTADHARDRELRGFAGTVAHDLKSPLTALSGWVELAQDELAGHDAAAGRAALAKAREASVRMRRLIDDYLAFTVTREGLLRLGDVPLAELVREVADSYPREDPLAPTFQLDVTHVSRADRTLTRQLLANLVGNAVKYARPSERAHIDVRSIEDAEPGWVQVVVADRGVGIQPGDEERIFDVFTRSEKDAEQFLGTGLGLALCHSIVTRHGGHIRAESNEHGGATFRFTLPKA